MREEALGSLRRLIVPSPEQLADAVKSAGLLAEVPQWTMLNDTEQSILTAIGAAGLSTKEIAKTVRRAPRTVERPLARLRECGILDDARNAYRIAAVPRGAPASLLSDKTEDT
jgi:hypothetical protein